MMSTASRRAAGRIRRLAAPLGARSVAGDRRRTGSYDDPRLADSRTMQQRSSSSGGSSSIDADSELGGWRLDRWQAARSQPYNTVPGWDPDHWFELPLDNQHLFQSVRLQNFPARIIPGRLFTTRMPRSLHQAPLAAARFAEKARLAQLRLVIVLTEEQEYVQYAGTSDLVAFYEALGADVLSRPIPDFGVPQRKYLAEVINRATLALADGLNVLVHCAGGSGRTGIVVCGVLRNLGVHDTIAWARRQKSTYLLL